MMQYIIHMKAYPGKERGKHMCQSPSVDSSGEGLQALKVLKITLNPSSLDLYPIPAIFEKEVQYLS